MPDGIENPLEELMSWHQVVSEYEKWNLENTESAVLTCLEWAIYMKDLFDELKRVNAAAADDDEMPELISVNDSDLQNQSIDLQNQTGIFDWTPDNSFGEGPEIETGYSNVVDYI